MGLLRCWLPKPVIDPPIAASTPAPTVASVINEEELVLRCTVDSSSRFPLNGQGGSRRVQGFKPRSDNPQICLEYCSHVSYLVLYQVWSSPPETIAPASDAAVVASVLLVANQLAYLHWTQMLRPKIPCHYIRIQGI